MTGTDFLNLCPECSLVMEGKTYRVEETDRMGRVKLQYIEYYIDVWEFQDDGYGTYDEAQDNIANLIEETKSDLENLNERISELDDDDAELDDIQEEIDNAEELLDNLEFCDVETRESGEPFWMHYKDIDADLTD